MVTEKFLEWFDRGWDKWELWYKRKKEVKERKREVKEEFYDGSPVIGGEKDRPVRLSVGFKILLGTAIFLSGILVHIYLGDDVIGVPAGDSWRFKNAYKLFTEAFVLCYFVSVFFDAGFHSNQQKTIQQCSVWIWDSSEYCYSCSIISVSANRWILYEF